MKLRKKHLKTEWEKFHNIERRDPRNILNFLRMRAVEFCILPDLIPGNKPRICFEKYSDFVDCWNILPELPQVFCCTARNQRGFWT